MLMPVLTAHHRDGPPFASDRTRRVGQSRCDAMKEARSGMTAAPVRPRQVLAGKFQVEKVVGVGGMGMVVAAHHLALRQRVALKLMLPELAAKAGFAARCVREARAAARVRSEHLTRVLNVSTLEDGSPYIVMEFLEGIDLHTLLRRNGPITAGAAAAVVLQACDAIAEAHSVGIVHRDLKPANLFITSRRGGAPLVKVLDLGICKLDDDDVELRTTSTTTTIGTPAYMAPEQMRLARSADARSDIWSLGVILYELVSGQVPFRAHTYAELCLRATLDPVPPLDPGAAPAEFAAVVARCLEKGPDRRFQTVDELTAALAPHASDVTVDVAAIVDVLGARAEATAVVSNEATHDGTVVALARRARPPATRPDEAPGAPPTRRWGRRAGVVAVFATVVAVAAIAATRSDDTAATSARSAPEAADAAPAPSVAVDAAPAPRPGPIDAITRPPPAPERPATARRLQRRAPRSRTAASDAPAPVETAQPPADAGVDILASPD